MPRGDELKERVPIGQILTTRENIFISLLNVAINDKKNFNEAEINENSNSEDKINMFIIRIREKTI